MPPMPPNQTRPPKRVNPKAAVALIGTGSYTCTSTPPNGSTDALQVTWSQTPGSGSTVTLGTEGGGDGPPPQSPHTHIRQRRRFTAAVPGVTLTVIRQVTHSRYSTPSLNQGVFAPSTRRPSCVQRRAESEDLDATWSQGA